jgi:hypothetical protein
MSQSYLQFLKFMALFFVTCWALNCTPQKPKENNETSDTASLGNNAALLKKNAKQILLNIKDWSTRNAAFLEQALNQARDTNPLTRLEKSGNMNLTDGAQKGKQNGLHQYLICNSPLRGFYVYGLLDSPLALPLLQKFSIINTVPGLNKFAQGASDKNFSVMGYAGVDIEEGFNSGLMLGNEFFRVPAVDFYMGAGVNFVWNDQKVYPEVYVGSLPIPIPYTPIIFDAELYAMTDYDEAGILLNYSLPELPPMAGVQIEPSIGLYFAFSPSKIAQLVDVDRWTGKKSTDCGEGTEQPVPVAALKNKPAFDAMTFPTPEEQTACKKQITRKDLAGNQSCHTGALVNSSANILECLKKNGGSTCLTADNRCGKESKGAFTCNIENAMDCLCSNGGMACFKDGFKVNNGGTGDKRVCWSNPI